MVTRTPGDVTAQLARFALSPGSSLPESARHAARRTIANCLGLMVGACRHPAYEIAYAATGADATPAQSTLIGHHEKASVTTTALLGGLAAHVEDFDDTHLRTVIHPGAPIVPAALAMAEYIGTTQDEFVEAVAYGSEVTLRIGLGLGHGHFDRGWHLTGTTGRFGAAIASGRLIGLSPEQMTVALGIAATEAAGLQEALGTMTKSLHLGKAAADGVEAALLASFGYSGPEQPIEGRRGLARTIAPEPDLEVICENLGVRWEIEANTFKPYACGIVSHPVIDAATALGAQLESQDVASVLVRTHPVVLDVMGVKEPTDGLQSKFSVYHCFAVGMLHGVGGPAQFSTRTARDPQVISLRKLVKVETDDSIAKDECYAVVEARDGRRLQHHVEHATASAANPMTDDQLIEKICLVAGPTLGADRAGQMAKAALALSGERNVSDLIAIACPSLTPSIESE